MDNIIREQFSVGGTGAYIHKYIGPQAIGKTDDPAHPNYSDGTEVDPITGELVNPDGIINETKIQDLLFMENRDRKYDKDIFEMRDLGPAPMILEDGSPDSEGLPTTVDDEGVLWRQHPDGNHDWWDQDLRIWNRW